MSWRPEGPGRRPGPIGESSSPRGRRPLAGLLAGLLVAGSALLAGAPAAASTSLAGAVPAVTEGAAGEVLVIMDVSGSMEREDASGTTLIDGARQAVDRLVDSAPAEAAVGLRLYGSEYAGDDEARGCRDTELAVPVGPLSQTGGEIRKAIEQAKPTGFTPIGHALAEAADDFSVEGQRSIVLVSDGEDTCPDPEPCAAAEELAAQGIDVRVDTVGLFLQDEPAARRQLQCIAKATGGRFHSADDAEALGRQLTAVSTRAIESFEGRGTEVDGGAAATRATEIEPGTPYVDDVGFGEARWYSLDVEEGQQVRVTLTESGSTEYGCCLTLWLRDATTDRIGSDNSYNSDGVAQTYVVETYEQGADESGTHYVEVALDADAGARGLVDYEMVVEVEGASAAESPTESPTETPTESASESASDAEPSDDAAGGEAGAAGAPGSDGGGTGPLWAAVGVLGVLVLVLGAAVLVLLRRLARG